MQQNLDKMSRLQKPTGSHVQGREQKGGGES
jgi:hypothetical protein